jgi:hypothetical protein
MRSLPRQQDLFEPRQPCCDLPLPHRVKAIELLKALLTEARGEPIGEIGSTKEGAGND